MSVITTVKGDIPKAQLGFTSMHDHTFLDLSVAGEFMKNIFPDFPAFMLAFKPENYTFLKSGVYLINEELQKVDDIDYLVNEYQYFKNLGGKSVVDPSPIGGRGKMSDLIEFSEKTGLNVICATGFYTATSRSKEYLGLDEDGLYRIMKKEVAEGIDGTDVRPGIIKCAIATMGPDGKIMQSEIDTVHAGARLAAETGLSLHIHTDATIPDKAIIDIVSALPKAYAVSPEKIVICHMDSRLACHVPVNQYLSELETARNINLDMHKELLELGMNIGLDTWGIGLENPHFFSPDSIDRIKALVLLIKGGYTSQITLGNDFSSKLHGKRYGGYGCTRFIEAAFPVLTQMGMETAIQDLVINNPARILAH